MKKLSYLLLICLLVMSCKSKDPVDIILDQLTTRQKIAQLIMISMDSYNPPELRAIRDSLVKAEGIGGFIVMEDQILRSMDRIRELQAISDIPLMFAIDGEWGASMRYAEMPFFPRQIQLGALPNDSLVYEMGLAVGKQCKDLGIQINFAPDVDININPRNPVINSRSFGSNRDIVAQYGSAYMRGMQDAGIYACAKHFPGHGDTETDSHKALPTLAFSIERLDSIELVPFKKLIDDGVALVMLGHLNIPSLDSVASTISYNVVTRLLKEKLGFKGIVVSDALSMKGLSEGKKAAEVTYLAYRAGIDLLLMTPDVSGSIDLIEAGIKSGELSEKDLNNRVRKILNLKKEAGLLDSYPSIPSNQEDLAAITNRPQDKALNQAISDNSIIDCGTQEAIEFRGKIAYIGYGAEYQIIHRHYGEQGGLSGYNDFSGVLEDNSTIVYNYLKEKNSDDAEVTYFQLPLEANINQLTKLKKEVAQYDAVIFGCHRGSPTGHNMLDISTETIEFIQNWAKEQPITILYFGNPYDLMKWNISYDGKNPIAVDFPHFLVGFADTPQNEQAVAKILTGELKAVGTMPVNW